MFLHFRMSEHQVLTAPLELNTVCFYRTETENACRLDARIASHENG